jgi:serine/threonine-protein kinase
MTTRLTSALSQPVIQRLRAAWLALALFLVINWIPRIADTFVRLPAGDNASLLSAVLGVVVFLAFGAVALTLFRRRGDDWLALFTGMMLLLTAFGYTGSRLSGTVWAYMSFPMVALMETFQVIFFYIFPNGKFLPRWAKYGILPLFIFRFLIWENIYRNRLPQGALEVGIVVLLLLIGIGLQVYRYRRQANAVERQQVKWLLVGFTATIVLVAPSVYALSIFTDEFSAWAAPVAIVRTLALLFVPISIGISVMRYRLWDLDLTINRSVVGAVVTGFLALVFGVVFVAAQAAIQAIFGPQSAVFAAAAGTAVTGALFNPARHRVRRFIDRKLYDLRFDLNDLRAVQTLTGTTIGNVEIRDVLGRGGMGEVYLGAESGRLVAVKIMPPEIASEGKNALRFDREIEALKVIDHPNIVHLLGSGVQDNQRYLVMDYVEGRDLTQTLRETGALPQELALNVAKQIGTALTYLHGQQQIHRDVTCGNIMLRPKGDSFDAILMDFGLVKMLTADHSITMSGDVMGTIDYMAPEQIVQTQTVDSRCDVYALACVYFEMLTGRRPFTGGAAQVLFAHLYQPPPDPRNFAPELPKPLAQVILRGLAKLPEDRFGSVADFLSAIDASLRVQLIAAA